MDKVYTIARTAAVLLAIVAAFVMVPQAALILLVLGGVAALGHNSAEENVHTYLIAIVLTIGASALAAALEGVGPAGGYIAAIFGNIATVAIGASVVAIAVGLVNGLKSAWMK